MFKIKFNFPSFFLGCLIPLIALYIQWKTYNINKQEYTNKNFSNLNVGILKNENNSFEDEFIFSCKNNDITIEKVEISLLNYEFGITTFKTYKLNFTTKNFKDIVYEVGKLFIWTEMVDGKYKGNNDVINSETYNYPFAVTFYYIQFAEKKTLTLFYDYNFKIYSSNYTTKIKTIGIEYLSEISDTSKANKVLNNYTLNSNIVTYNRNFLDSLHCINLIMKDSILQPLYNWSLLNLKSTLKITTYINSSNETKVDLKRVFPATFVNESLYKQSESLIIQINKNKAYYNEFLFNEFKKIVEEGKSWSEVSKYKMTVQEYKERLKEDRNYTLHADRITRWKNSNKFLIKLISIEAKSKEKIE